MNNSIPVQVTPRKTPRHVVVFQERSGPNDSVLADALQIKQAAVPDLRSSCLEFEPRAPDLARPRLYQRLAAATADLNPDEEERLRKNPRVRAVVRNQLRSIVHHDKPIDPGLAVQAANGEAGGNPPPQVDYNWHLAKIGVGGVPSTGRNVTVAILDSGIDLGHPDFNGRIREGTVNDGANGVSFIAGEPLQDINGHGTHCAGLVAGRPAGGGLAYGISPDVNLLVGKVLNQLGRGFDNDVLEAIDWAADKGARIISLSLGTPRAQGDPFDPLYERVASALFEENPGVLLLAAAGNESQRRNNLIAPVINPAACPSILSVAAVNQDNAIAVDSCGQTDTVGEVNFSAPGVNVYSAWPGGVYRLTSGTSTATPIVAGVAALILEMDPRLAAAELKNQLQKFALPLAPQTDFGAGLVQVPSA
jgi:subtilisin family serine protease